jgi:hypothetical protein
VVMAIVALLGSDRFATIGGGDCDGIGTGGVWNGPL